MKLRKTVPVKIASELLVVRRGPRILLRLRDQDARHMRGFWDLPGTEDLPHADLGDVLGEFRHTITHHHYTFTVRSATVRKPARGYRWFALDELAGIPCATTARKALKLLDLAARPVYKL